LIHWLTSFGSRFTRIHIPPGSRSVGVAGFGGTSTDTRRAPVAVYITRADENRGKFFESYGRLSPSNL
jgi:hypothetical protein